jgi:acyl-CoA synthetase (AMP-forming)/AMP-acid ligase II
MTAPVGSGPQRVWPIDFDATISSLAARAEERYGNADFIVTEQQRWSFAQTSQAGVQLSARLLELGFVKGSRVGLLLGNGWDWVVTFLGCARIGCIVIPLSTFASPPELTRTLRHADIEHLITARWLFGQDTMARLCSALPSLSERQEAPLALAEAPFLRRVWFVDGDATPWSGDESLDVSPGSAPGEKWRRLADRAAQEVRPADVLATIYTSGSSGDPKGVVHTHGSQVRHAANLARMRGVAAGDSWFAGLPFFWVGGLTYTMLLALYAGVTLVCQEKFEAESAFELVQREQPDRMWSWPIARERIAEVAHSRGLQITEFPCLVQTPEEAEPEAYHNSLGMTETSGPNSGPPQEVPGRQQRLPEHLHGSWGPSLPYVEHKVVDPIDGSEVPTGAIGEICVRGYNLMVGLYKHEREEVFDRDGWYHTGDMGSTREGTLFFVGRRTEMLKVAGSNVAPSEVEAVLLALPEVEAAFVFGVPDAQRGDMVVASVVLESGSATWSPESLTAKLHHELSAFKVPRYIAVIAPSEVPFLSSGKVDRLTLRRQWMKQLSAKAEAVGLDSQ